jgi:DNA recombination protein RmuC
MASVYLYIVSGGVAGGVLVFIFALLRQQNLIKEKFILQSRNEQLMEENNRNFRELNLRQDEIVRLSSLLSETTAHRQNLEKRLEEQAIYIKEQQEQLKLQFESLARQIMEENTDKFSRQNKENLQLVLDPLKEKIKAFEERVNKTHQESTEQSSALNQQMKLIMELGIKMGKEAEGLTRALKGDNKHQGNWGEFILEKVLESSGLEKGREYDVQVHTSDDEGNKQIPDVVIYLPEERHLIIDSKVSLNAYEEWVNADTDSAKQKAILRHISSLQNHIKGLSERHYIAAKNINSPDFVLMFLPIEASLGVSLLADNEIFDFAWKRRVVIVTPSTLLATLKTVGSIWKYEKQNANAQKIAEMGRLLYDQFVEFLDEMAKIDRGIEMSRHAYDDAMKRLSSSSHSIVNRVQKLKSLGVAPRRNMDKKYFDQPEDIIEIGRSEETE